MALGRLEIHPPDDFINAWIKHATASIGYFNSQNLANSILALGRLEIHPPDDFVKAWVKHATASIGYFNSQNLANSLSALGRLEIHPPDDFINAWIKHATATIKQFNHQDLSNSIYGIFILNVLCNSKIKVLQQFINSVNSNTTLFDNKDISQILKAHYYFSKTGTGILTSQNRQLLERKYKSTLEPCRTSNLQLDVLKIVKKVLAPQDIKSEFYIKQTTSNVDIFIKGQNIVIQVDGPSHFDDNNAPNFSTRLNSTLLSLYQYKVLRISYWNWDKCKTMASKESYISELLSKMNLFLKKHKHMRRYFMMHQKKYFMMQLMIYQL
ncbi:RAP domain protein [Orientia chuto str. Dubai]|uniref:RAP domain protein n=1 Tax=Orientia chuto str. Dubai TaxID=1359168 RepID=A0A0F3MNF4_9RICK|nr:RAP domain-containing protein [Candidatus Orientia mediorientalis]KJV57270.1 RAP domain protein [Orientia chuto str. Dubai]